MSATYSFKKIDNYKGLRYHCDYTQNEFYFGESLYFTTIFTKYADGSYTKVRIYPDGVHVYGDDILNMLDMGIKVNLVVKGKGTAALILPLVSIDDEYAHFSNDELSLTVDVNGAVADVTDGGDPQ